MAPLTGVRVITMALNAPGPLACQRLAADGAHITKVEPPGGDPLKALCPSWYDELHRRVAVIEQIDLKADAGQQRMRAMLAEADVFMSSQRPAALMRLRLDHASLPDLRSLNIVGELKQPEIPGHDITYQAQGGLLDDASPQTLIADVMGSERAYAAVLLLLRQPAGSHIDVGLYDSLEPMLAPIKHGLTAPGGLLRGGLPAYGVYRTRDGYVAIGALEAHFQERLYAALRIATGSGLSEVMLARTASEWERWGRERDLPLAQLRDWENG